MGEVVLTLSAGLNRRGVVGDFLNLPDAGVGVGETRELFGRVALGWRPGPAFSLTVDADANDGDKGLNPYTTLIDEIPGRAVYGAGYRNADVAPDPYDNNTGQTHQARVTNAARGVAVNTDWAATDRLTAKMIAGVRYSLRFRARATFLNWRRGGISEIAVTRHGFACQRLSTGATVDSSVHAQTCTTSRVSAYFCVVVGGCQK